MPERVREILAKIRDWWNKYTARQKTLIVIITTSVIFAFAILIYVLTRPKYVVLMRCDNAKQSSEVISILNSNDIVNKTYALWRMRIFLSMFFGYIIFYTCRKNISVALPAIQEALGYSKLELGLLGSSLYFSYAAGKFINGIIADNTNAKR